jgi:hypothetical protein
LGGQHPFYLRTGKTLAKRTTEIVIQYKGSYLSWPKPNNRLILNIQPDEGISFLWCSAWHRNEHRHVTIISATARDLAILHEARTYAGQRLPAATPRCSIVVTASKRLVPVDPILDVWEAGRRRRPAVRVWWGPRNLMRYSNAW